MNNLIGQTILHYKILEKIGEGGMGEVYKALDTKLDRFIALKFLPPQFSSPEIDKTRFLIEAKAAAALNHPNISIVHSIEEVGENIFIVMEYIEGSHLKDKINNDGITINEAASIAAQIAAGLGAAHKKGIIHRDIKSSNIMITDEGKVKIMDFGLAKIGHGVHSTSAGTTMGTTVYMSPEQVKGDDIDYRTDIWSFGVVLYEMLTGKLPFWNEYEQAVVYLILNQDPESIFSFNKDIPHYLERILKKSLHKDKNFRYQNINEIIDEIEKNNRITNRQKITDKNSIAVLPFENISPDKDADYFADGLAEELIVSLTKLKKIKVIPRTISFRYKNTDLSSQAIGYELGASHVVTGSVRKFRDKLRISVQISDIISETQKWAETYKGKLIDIFDIQEQISKQIVDVLSVDITPNEQDNLKRRRTLNADAFDYYLKARNFLYSRTKNNLEFAMELFQKAIDLDTKFASSYAGLGEAYAAMYYDFDSNEAWLNKAIESSFTALIQDPTLSEAYTALGFSYFCKKSVQEAIIAIKKAIELDPYNFITYWILGRIYHSTNNSDKAIDLYKKAIELNPDFHTAYTHLRMIYEQLGEKEKLKELINELCEIFPEYLLKHPNDARARTYYAKVLAGLGNFDEAKNEEAKAIKLNPDDPLMVYNAACFYSLIGEKVQALNFLKEAIRLGFANYDWIKVDSDLNNIRNEPEFIEIVKGKKPSI
jgi:serine/threonine protein kinase/Flp pilus assembly protein TadD